MLGRRGFTGCTCARRAARCACRWRWANGTCALNDDGGGADQRQQEDYERLSLSPEEWQMRRHAAGRAVARLSDDVRGLVQVAGTTAGGSEEAFGRRVAVVRADLDSLPAELERIETYHADYLRTSAERRAKERKED